MRTDEGPLRSRTLVGVLAITALSLVLRLVALGGRIFHWDEGRVGYWILRYQETGEFFYRPIIHGPFLPVVNQWLFTLVPVSDFAARLPVAVVGGLLPLAAWLFRDRLDDTEVVALAAVFALNPLLVYYSRFMRNDVLVATFSLVALGFFVRAYDTGDTRLLVPSAASLALGFTAKENAVLYVLCFLGAGVLILDHRLLRATADGRSPGTVVFGDWFGAARTRLADGETPRAAAARVAGWTAVALVVFLGVVVFFYAPRPDLWRAFGDPAGLVDVVERGSVGAWQEFYSSWVEGGHQDHDYLPYLADYLETMLYGAPVVVSLAVVGFVVDRYSVWREGYRGLVAFAVYWGAASIVGYPMATDIQAPWTVVHAVVPLSIPAAVGAAYLFEAGLSSIEADDAIGATLAGLVLLAAVGGAVGLNVDYWNSAAEEDKQVLQWAQPSNDLQSTLERVRAVSRANEGTDVLFYGTHSPTNEDETLFYVQNESTLDRMPPGGPAWHSRLPLPWYLERYGANVTSTPPDTPPEQVASNAPPVVVAYAFDRHELEPHLDGYTAYTHEFKLWGEDVVVFIDRSALQSTGASADVDSDAGPSASASAAVTAAGGANGAVSGPTRPAVRARA